MTAAAMTFAVTGQATALALCSRTCSAHLPKPLSVLLQLFQVLGAST